MPNEGYIKCKSEGCETGIIDCCYDQLDGLCTPCAKSKLEQLARLLDLLEDRPGLEHAICRGAGAWEADDSETKSEAEHIADKVQEYLKEALNA